MKKALAILAPLLLILGIGVAAYFRSREDKGVPLPPPLKPKPESQVPSGDWIQNTAEPGKPTGLPLASGPSPGAGRDPASKPDFRIAYSRAGSWKERLKLIEVASFGELESAFDVILQDAQSGEVDGLRITALLKLGELGMARSWGPRVVLSLRGLLPLEKAPVVRRGTLAALNMVNLESASDESLLFETVSDSLHRDPDASVRSLAASNLAFRSKERSIPTLEAALTRETDPDAKTALQQALERARRP